MFKKSLMQSASSCCSSSPPSHLPSPPLPPADVSATNFLQGILETYHEVLGYVLPSWGTLSTFLQHSCFKSLNHLSLILLYGVDWFPSGIAGLGIGSRIYLPLNKVA